MGKSVYAIVTERIVKLIEAAIATGEPLPWKKPWSVNSARNYVTAHSYRGINALLLPPGEYITWSQICDLKKDNPAVGLKKGCQRELVVYFNYTAAKGDGKEEEEKKQYPFLRYYYVYNVKHVAGLEPHEPVKVCHHEPIAEANRIMMSYISRENITLEHIEGDKACYSPISDKITLPKMEQFYSGAEYYSTAFHEMVHSTGAKRRLDRKLSTTFGETSYSREELLAEMGASMLLGTCGIATTNTEKNSAAYMRSWIKVLNDNVGMVVSAASKAQAAVEYILNS